MYKANSFKEICFIINPGYVCVWVHVCAQACLYMWGHVLMEAKKKGVSPGARVGCSCKHPQRQFLKALMICIFETIARNFGLLFCGENWNLHLTFFFFLVDIGSGDSLPKVGTARMWWGLLALLPAQKPACHFILSECLAPGKSIVS